MSHELQQAGQSGSSAHPVPSLPLDIWGATDKGRQREGNEDSVYPHSGLEASSFVPSQAHLQQQGMALLRFLQLSRLRWLLWPIPLEC